MFMQGATNANFLFQRDLWDIQICTFGVHVGAWGQLWGDFGRHFAPLCAHLRTDTICTRECTKMGSPVEAQMSVGGQGAAPLAMWEYYISTPAAMVLLRYKRHLAKTAYVDPLESKVT